MTHSLVSAALSLVLGVEPAPIADNTHPPTVRPVESRQYDHASSESSAVGDETAVDIVDPLYPYDAPEPWQHGYFQEIPAYGGFHAFRPYNYRHVLAQTQLSAEWGLSATSPYSQGYWDRYQRRAAMEEIGLSPQPTAKSQVELAGGVKSQQPQQALPSRPARQSAVKPVRPARTTQPVPQAAPTRVSAGQPPAVGGDHANSHSALRPGYSRVQSPADATSDQNRQARLQQLRQTLQQQEADLLALKSLARQSNSGASYDGR